MSEIISFPLPAGPNFNIPDVGELNWGQAVTDLLVAIPNGVPPTAGTFDLTGDLSFGSSFGLVTKYFKSISPDIATTGSFRMAHGDSIAFRNFNNNGDLLLSVDSSDNILFNGQTFGIGGAVNPGTANQLGYYATSTDAISGLPLITANRALISNGSGLPVASTVTATTLAFMDATSSVQTQINSVTATANAALPEAGGTMTGDINMGSNKITNMDDGTSPSDAATFGQITALLPSGVMVDFGGTSAPSGWLLCDGSVVSQTTYATLFAAISTNWNTGGEGAGNFRLPDFRRRVAVGSGGTGSGTLGNAVGNTGGEEKHTMTTGEIATHSHSVTDPGHNHTYSMSNGGGFTFSVPQQVTTVALQNSGVPTGTSTTGISIVNTGSSTPFNVIQPSAVVLKIIKT